MKSMMDAKADLFSEDEVIAMYIDTNNPWGLNALFGSVRRVIFEEQEPEPCHKFFEVIKTINHEEEQELNYTIKNIYTFEEVKDLFAKKGINLISYAEAVQRIKDNGFNTGDESTLSDEGWYDLVETSLRKYADHIFYKDDYDYDFDKAPDHIKDSKQMAFEYAISGLTDHPLVKKYNLFSDKDTVLEIMKSVPSYNDYGKIFKATPEDILLSDKVFSYCVRFYNELRRRLTEINPSKIDERIIQTIINNDVMCMFYEIRENKIYEPLILRCVLKKSKDKMNFSDADIDNMSNREVYDNVIKLYRTITSWEVSMRSLPDHFRSNRDFIARTNRLDEADRDLQNDPELATAYCNEHPERLLYYKSAWNCNKELFMKFLQTVPDINEPRNKDIMKIVKNQKFDEDEDICKELIRRDICMLHQLKLKHLNKDFIVEAVEAQSKNYACLTDEGKHDPDILNALRKTKTLDLWIKDIPDDLLDEATDIILQCPESKICGTKMQLRTDHGECYAGWTDIPEKCLTDDVILHLIETHPGITACGHDNFEISELPDSVQISDRFAKTLMSKPYEDEFAYGEVADVIAKRRPDLATMPEIVEAQKKRDDVMKTFEQMWSHEKDRLTGAVPVTK